MATSDNYENTLQLTAPAGGVVVGTVIRAATSLMAIMPMTAATSGNTYTGKVSGLIKSSVKSSAAAWVVGQSLRFTSLSKWAITTINTQVSQGSAAAVATSGAIAGDVILRLPVAGHI